MNFIHHFFLSKVRVILVLGFGETGTAVAIWAAKNGFPVRIADTRDFPKGLEKFSLHNFDNAKIEYCLGKKKFNEKLLNGISQLVISPSFSPIRNPIKKLIRKANSLGIEIVNEIEIFSRILYKLKSERGYSPNILAITGTNGKTTVTTLTGRLVKTLGLSVKIAGNIGPSALSALLESLDANKLPEVWVLELSSFQLWLPISLIPDAAVLLNVTQDHLDWHGNMKSYRSCKMRLLESAKTIIVNRNDHMLFEKIERQFDKRKIKSFGVDAPEELGDIGLEKFHDGILWLTSCDLRKKHCNIAGSITKEKKRLFPIRKLKLKGMHNVLNVMAAFQLIGAIKPIYNNSLFNTAIQYAGEIHRLTFVCTKSGIDYIDDSKSTNVGSTVAALESMEKKSVLILGGISKNQDFSPLVLLAKNKVKAIILIGRDASLISSTTIKSQIPHFEVSNLSEAIKKSAALASAGDVVLFSPGCSSTDMFQNYLHRGQDFVRNVLNLEE